MARYILGVHRMASKAAIRGELALLPLLLKQCKLVIKYLFRVSRLHPSSFAFKAFKLNVELEHANTPNWLSGIKNIMTTCGLNHTWKFIFHQTRNVSLSYVINATKSKLLDIYQNQWISKLHCVGKNSNEGNKLRSYALFKSNFSTENYLKVIKSKDQRSSLTRLRISAHNLLIEKGRRARPHKIPANERFCPHCNDNSIEDDRDPE